MLIRFLRISGLLSFGREGLIVPLRSLNVLIGPNGSGKSNMLEIIALLKAAPQRLSSPFKAAGGIRDWLWKEADHHENVVAVETAIIEAEIAPLGTDENPPGPMYNHVLEIGSDAGRFELVREIITAVRKDKSTRQPALWGYSYVDGIGQFKSYPPADPEGKGRSAKLTVQKTSRNGLSSEESVLSQVKDPFHYPFLSYLQGSYSRIQLYRRWSFGPDSPVREGSRIEDPDDFLYENGANLASVVGRISNNFGIFQEFKEALRQVYDGLEDLRVGPQGGRLQVYVIEAGGRQIAATRLSDGTLRYLCLLAILMHPQPPPLIAIEEPELGLHPDLLPGLAALLVRASERTQLVITTHSRTLVDALGEEPENVVVCEKVDGQSRFERLDAERLEEWLRQYTLGKLWSMGEIGGSRW